MYLLHNLNMRHTYIICQQFPLTILKLHLKLNYVMILSLSIVGPVYGGSGGGSSGGSDRYEPFLASRHT